MPPESLPGILVKGLSSGYEVEHLVRVFFPGAKPVGASARDEAEPTGRIPKGPLVYARAGRRQLAAGLRLGGRVAVRRAPLNAATAGDEKALKLTLCRLLYDLLKDETGLRPPWGLLTGVRPLSLLRKQCAAGGEAVAEAHFLQKCDVSREKYDLACRIADTQRPFLEQNAPPGYSLYVSIPFCPTRCAYCSFVSKTIAREGHLIGPYLEKLELELAETAKAAKENGLELRTIYIGGGTPTALDEAQLDTLLAAVARHFDTRAVTEYTVEAGRPDCTSPAKLALLRQYGVGRVSINPQSMRDEVLRAIGRSHNAQDIRNCYAEAQKLGFDAINMDLIAGLPGDDIAGFIETLDEVIALAPGNLTLHTLTLKRASDLAQQRADDSSSPAAMLKAAYPKMAAAGYHPYYLYRQKSTLENLENTGWTKPGLEGVYNICIMEEVHSILAVGAGAVTKLVAGGPETAIKRLYNHKFPADYLAGHETVLERKRGVKDFYAGNLDSQTPGGDRADQHGG
ncbi:coproporphyrinogen dehydrogenase HemZ [Ruminococcaceae bacterium OttesenSCG-928-D13]|nr:coproporphyrinogen dehydrogenase HemZ [Ruminococcaceae bacterium OttesenSCG-928-D13]